MEMSKVGMLARRILRAVQQKHFGGNNGLALAYDGSKTVYGSKRLFTPEEAATSRARAGTDAEGKNMAGKYGPEDTGGYNAPAARDVLCHDYYVTVKKDCEDSDPEQDRVKNAHFRVTLTEVAELPLRHVLEQNLETAENAKTDELRRAMDVMLKTSAFSLMYAPGKSPRRFYFPEDNQEDIQRNSQIVRDFTNSRVTYAPFIGLSQAVRFCANGNVFVNADSCVNFFDRENYYQAKHARDPPRPVALLDEGAISICGIPVRDFYRPITDPNIKRNVEEALKKINFHVKYVRSGTPEFRKRVLDRGKSEEWIRRKLTEVRRNCRMKPDVKANGRSIIWSCDDPNEYSFLVEPRKPYKKDDQTEEEHEAIINALPPGVTHTLASYYKEKKGISLKFPYMPAVFIGKNEWFPLEFLSQAFGKSKDANGPNHVKAILGYFDDHAGSRCVDNVTNLMKRLVMEQDRAGVDVFQQFSMTRSDEPMQFKAKVLPLPKIIFGNEGAELRNGSWDLRNKKFYRSSDLCAFCVIDGGGGSGRFMDNLFKVMERHGMELPPNMEIKKTLDVVTHRADLRNPESVYDAFRTAIEKAKDYFWHDRTGEFSRNKVFFKTVVKNPEGEASTALLIPPSKTPNNCMGCILPHNLFPYTHTVEDGTGKKMDMRLMYSIEGGTIVDPFNFRFRNGTHEALDPQGTYRSVRNFEIVYQNESTTISERDLRSQPFPIISLEPWQIDKPMVFVYLPSDNAQTYHQCKLMAHFEFGVPSQCAVSQKFTKQRNPDQYCSNIALKCNAKLMNKLNMARAWNTTDEKNVDGIPWIRELPTMVVGINTSHGLGQDSISVVAATVGLDVGCMQFAHSLRVQTKDSVLSKPTVMAIIKSLYIQFEQHTGCKPMRLLLYRDGASEGEFDRLIAREIAAVRLALYELKEQDALSKGETFTCPNEKWCKKNGCIFCTIPITFVVSQSQHSIRIVPRDEPGGRDKNVPSGTCVDHTIMDVKDSQNIATNQVPKQAPPGATIELFEDANSNGYDFLLTSQGGLKGTSKPIFYRVLLNENAVWRAGPNATSLTKEQLQIATYFQSYQYGTATKAVRGIPVIYYSTRLANMCMGYVNYLRGKKESYLPSDRDTPLVNYELKDDEEEKYLPKGNDGVPLDRFMMIRRDLAESELPPEIKSEILPDFSPFNPNVQGFQSAPFRPHLSA